LWCPFGALDLVALPNPLLMAFKTSLMFPAVPGRRRFGATVPGGGSKGGHYIGTYGRPPMSPLRHPAKARVRRSLIVVSIRRCLHRTHLLARATAERAAVPPNSVFTHVAIGRLLATIGAGGAGYALRRRPPPALDIAFLLSIGSWPCACVCAAKSTALYVVRDSMHTTACMSRCIYADGGTYTQAGKQMRSRRGRQRAMA
jgi:hypothetical protein